MAVLLRRRRLGRTSCREISAKSSNSIVTVRSDRRFPTGHDLVFRWGCTATVPVRNVVNTASAIHEVNDKVGFRVKLDEHDLCPPTWTRIEDIPEEMLLEGIVVRPKRHSRGRNIRLCHNLNELREAYRAFGEGSYFSKKIDKVAEYRVFVVSGRVVTVAKKTPGNPDDLAWNVARGGRFDVVRWGDWPMKAVRIAVEGFELSSLDFGGVDVMVDADGECYILEINSAPSLTSDYRQTCMAKAFDYIIENGKQRIPRIEERGGYRKFIHPAVCDNAILAEE